ncbi:PLP-dependent aminotransferase family protein [Thermomonospora catenispora]|uniref:aminotransferase-like domain-containing protein n=1 Tax=Thermomonospora catenispora TaxID=2493090 RepID=UPI001F4F9436|nr:PLP-dependent aminotransferase family protein [Thermomonospora catenispora]
MAAVADLLRAEAVRRRPGDRLPSSRALVARLGVSPVTVSRALARLAAEGLVVTRPGSGTFVAERARAARPRRPVDHGWQAVALGDRAVDPGGVAALLTPPSEGVIAMGGGYLPASLQPLRALAAAAARAARRPDAWDRPPPAGIDGLRAWFARTVGGEVAPADVLVTGGGQQAIGIALRAVLPPGAPLLVESPTYQGVLSVARAAGLHTVPVPVDGSGVRPDLLADAFAMTGARAFYCQPTFHNPTGTVLTPERREQVLSVARAAGAFVIEDDFARHLAIDPAPPPLVGDDPDGRVVHISSLTKVVAPSLRIGALIARGPVAERLRALQVVDSFFPSRHLQETALELVSSPAWERHRRAVRVALRERRDAVAAALARELPDLAFELPRGGQHLWVRLPEGVDDVALADAALREGVAVNAGRPYFPAEPDGAHLRIGYSRVASVAELAEGVRRLARALEGYSLDARR